jgi:exocyst complex component 3
MEFSALEEEAQRKAAQHVANMLHTPDKLEKVHQMKWNASRKKASVEAMLKTAMQSQLDGVQTGLGQLETALTEIREVSEHMQDIETGLQELPHLVEVLDDVKRETSRHSQLATARENLKNLFTVPEVVEQTNQDIMDGKLLVAHKALAELENSRDDLLLELHKLQRGSNNTSCSHVDKQLLNDYFAPVSKLNTTMEKQIRFVLRRTLNTVRKDPKMVVTALRIVEREEKLDSESEAQQKATGFLPPGRPKQWKKIALQVLRQNVVERIEGNQLDEREQNKMWLVRHLELMRQITLEDLRVAKSLCQPVFPPEYNIYEHFIELYNEALTNRLNEIITMGLKDQEYVSMLSWIIQTYPGKELMANERLQIAKDSIKPLLDSTTIEKLEEEYLSNMKDNYVNWMGNTMKLEKEDWMKDKEPEVSDGAFHTSAPKMIYQMIEENLQVAATISAELTNKVLALSLGEVANFGSMYRTNITEYKSKYFNNRNDITMFTRYMIAIINNCERFEDLALDVKQRWWKSSAQMSEIMILNFESVLKTFSELRRDSTIFLLDEAFIDIDIHFTEILSTKWLTETRAGKLIHRISAIRGIFLPFKITFDPASKQVPLIYFQLISLLLL